LLSSIDQFACFSSEGIFRCFSSGGFCGVGGSANRSSKQLSRSLLSVIALSIYLGRDVLRRHRLVASTPGLAQRRCWRKPSSLSREPRPINAKFSGSRLSRRRLRSAGMRRPRVRSRGPLEITRTHGGAGCAASLPTAVISVAAPASLRSGQLFTPTIAAQLFQA
jgi:hypothetical protein